jgi:pimeloyl-ACP methyl ester carboxylesterase
MTRICLLVTAVLLSANLPIFSQQPEIKNLKRGKDHEINKQKFTTYEGHIVVPENWNNPTAKTIQLPVFIIKSKSKQPAEPIFWFTGGPGASNIRGTNNLSLLENHDFICVGYRGADGSIILKSKKVAKAMKGVNHKLLSNESLDNLGVKAKEYLAELKKDGIDISQYTIMEVIEDMEYVRKALGYEKINLFSGSYGTRVALLYSYKYPEVVKRSVMNGVNPPGHFVWDSQQTEHILDIYDSLYKSQNLPDYKGSIKAVMKKSFEKMPKRWSFFKLDPDKIKTTTFALMFQKGSAIMTFDAYFSAANRNDYSGLYLLQLAYDYLIPRGSVHGDLFQKGCADFDPNVNYREKLKSDNTALGYNMALLLMGGASSWYNGSIPEEYKKVRMSQTETLLIGSNLDVSTPPENATKELLPFLPNGHQVILRNMSHQDVSSLQADSYNKLVARYFDTGAVNESLFHYDEIDFKPAKRFSSLAKWYYPAVLIASIFK